MAQESSLRIALDSRLILKTARLFGMISVFASFGAGKLETRRRRYCHSVIEPPWRRAGDVSSSPFQIDREQS